METCPCYKETEPASGGKIILSASKMIEQLRVINVEVVDTLKLAVKEGLTYYDASYLEAAHSSKSELITDEKKLREKAKKYVKASSTA